MAEQDDSLMGKTIFSRIGFTLLVLIVFFIVLRIGIIILSYINSPKGEVELISGMINGNSKQTYYVNPNKKDSFPIQRSDNQDKGIEFTWSFWINIDGAVIDEPRGAKLHVWNKGNIVENNNNPPTSFTLNGPGCYLERGAPNSGESVKVNMHIDMDTDYQNTNNKESIVINNLSINKWINVIIRGEHNTIDVFIEGVLIQRTVSESPLRQNFGDVYVGHSLNGNVGFDGKISKLTYYDKSIGTRKIMEIQNSGPNITLLNTDKTDTISSYFSQVWYNTSLNNT